MHNSTGQSLTRNLIIIGAVGNCIDILDILNDINVSLKYAEYTCIGFLDDDESKWQSSINDVPVLGGISTAKLYDDTYFINGIGSPTSFRLRKQIVGSLGVSDKRFATIAHPTAVISKLSRVGRGNIFFQNITITTNVVIGNHICVLPASVISHDCRVRDYTCIASGVVLSGNVTIGESCYIGAGSSVKEGITIGDNSLIGLGSVVLRDVEPNSVVVGNPARYLKRDSH